MATTLGAEQLPAKRPPHTAKALAAVAAGTRSGRRGRQDLGQVEADRLFQLSVGAGAGVAVGKAGLPKIRLRDVRHSYASAALAAGIPAKIVSERLERNHRSQGRERAAERGGDVNDQPPF
jgi:integrase